MLTQREINWLAQNQLFNYYGKGNQFSINVKNRPDSLIDKMIIVWPNYRGWDIQYYKLKEEFSTKENMNLINNRGKELDEMDN